MMKRFHNLKLEYKLIISHFLLIAIPTIAILCIYGAPIKDIVYTDTIAQEQALSDQTSLTLNSTMEQVPKISNALQESTLIRNLTTHSAYYTRNPYATFLNDLEQFEELVGIQTEGNLITNVKIYTDNLPTECYTAQNTEQSLLAPMSAALGTYWNGIFAGSDITELYCPTFYLSPTEEKTLGDLAYITKYDVAYDSDNPLYVVLYFSQDELDAILSQNTSISSSVTYIINERNSIVASSDYKTLGTYIMEYENVVETASSYDRFITQEILDEEVCMGCYSVSGTDWYMVSVLPMDPIINNGILWIVQFAILYLILMAIAFFITNYLSHSITKRIKLLSNKMESVLNGPPERMDPPVIHDEIGDLINTYNYMSDEMNHLLDEQAKAAEEVRIAEFHALQAQINPHFLYNTMDMINWLSQSGQNKEVTEAVQALSKFYKLTLSKKTIITTVDHEVEHVSLYVKLQNMRYENKIDFLIDIPDSLMALELPKLTFQPVVENAIQHGILEKDDRSGSIVITGWMEDNELVIIVSDDGVGIPAERLPHILDGTTGSKKGSNIGIYNTHERLKTLYGGNSGLTYTSTVNVGTEVEIRIQLPDPEETQLA